MRIGKLLFAVVLAAILLLDAGQLAAQVVHLPSVVPPSERHPAIPVSHEATPTEPLEMFPAPEPPLGCSDPINPDRPPDARDGSFQRLLFDSTGLAPGSSNGLGMTELELKAVFGLPIPSRRSPLVITPGFAVTDLDRPDGSDLPRRLYDATLRLRWWKRINSRFGIDFAVTPGLYTDFERRSEIAFRYPGHIAALIEWPPTWKLLFGVAYLDREDLDLLPIGGLIWTPHPDIKFELVVPKPRIARRIVWSGACTEAVKDWVYLGGEFGGGTWAIHPSVGSEDLLNYRDLRLVLGLQRWTLRGLDARLEVGYVFGRRIEYRGSRPDMKPSDTVMVRAGLTY